jgi:hypothetical protein
MTAAFRLALAIALAGVLAACSPTTGPVPLAGGRQGNPTPTATPLAAEAPTSTLMAAAKPKATAKPRATAKTSSYYKPPGWDGVSDVNCPDFDTHAHAQSFFKGTGGTSSNDPYGLDHDHDGTACETLP